MTISFMLISTSGSVSIKLNDEISYITISTINRYANHTQEIEIEKLTQGFYSGSVTHLHPLSRVTPSLGSTMKNPITQVMILHRFCSEVRPHRSIFLFVHEVRSHRSTPLLFTRFDHTDLLPFCSRGSITPIYSPFVHEV